MKRLVIVTPVYEDGPAAARLFRELEACFGAALFVVAVDDGSWRAPLDPALLASAKVAGTVLTLRRNVGHQAAIAIGLRHVVGTVADAQAIVVMDSDGEDLPRSIGELLAPLQAAGVDVVVAQRRRRVASRSFRLFYRIYQALFRVLAGRALDFGNFMAMSPDAARRLVTLPSLGTHLAASVLSTRLRIVACPIDRGPRYAGHSQMNFSSLVLHGIRGLQVFDEQVLLRIGLSSAIVAGASVIAGVVLILLSLGGRAVPWAMAMLTGLLLFGCLQAGVIALSALLSRGTAHGATRATGDYRDFIDKVSHVERID